MRTFVIGWSVNGFSESDDQYTKHKVKAVNEEAAISAVQKAVKDDNASIRSFGEVA